MTQAPPVAKTLPFDLRTALVRASTIKDPMTRRKAIEEIEAKAKYQQPNLFRR